MLSKPDISRPGSQYPALHSAAMYAQLGLCPVCQSPVYEKDFIDEISRREYSITGLCQKCQDILFAEPEED